MPAFSLLGDKAGVSWCHIVPFLPCRLTGLALAIIADRTNDAELLRTAALHVDNIRAGRPWEQLFQRLDRVWEMNDLMLPVNYWDLLPLIGQVMGANDID